MNIDEISKKYNISPIVCELLSARNIDSEEELKKFLHPNDSCFYDPYKLKDMDRLVKRIRKAMENKERVLVFGDYDVDGVSATAILVKYFRSKNFNVDYYLPNRYVDGYGLTMETVKMLKEKFSPDLVITVDCGISCAKEVEYAKELGFEIAVTDHHDVPEELPQGIVVNAKLEGQEYPFKYLCGTGLAFKVVQALEGLEEAKRYLGIASIATIADIVPLVDENRAIVKLGKEKFDENLPLGIKMLFERNKLTLGCSSTDIAFRLAPKINASGRMGDASVSLELYLKDDKEDLKKAIEKLEEMNTERQALCAKVYDDAVSRLGNINVSNYNAIVLSSPDWDSGILGIVSAKLANEYNRPTVLFSEVDGLLKGSARSVADIDIYTAISSQKEVLEAFGGHKMAAGLTIKKSNFNGFLQNLNNYLSKTYTPKDYLRKKTFDMTLDIGQIDFKLIEDLEVLEPCGCDNPKPVFDILLPDNTTFTPMPSHPMHLTISACHITFVAFNCSKMLAILRATENRRVQSELQLNEYKGRVSIKGIVKNITTGEIEKAQEGDIFQAIYLKQLFCGEEGGKATVYSSDKLSTFIDKAREDYFGWLFVCSTFDSYKKLCKMIDFNVSHFEYEVISNSGQNAVLLAMNSFKNLNCFKNIVFVDAVLENGFLSQVNEMTRAKLYVPKNIAINKAVVEGVRLDRPVFVMCFNALSKYAQAGARFCNDFDLYRSIFPSKDRKEMSFKQFVFCFNVFVELGLFEVRDEEDGCRLRDNKQVYSKLEKSHIYKKMEFILKTI